MKKQNGITLIALVITIIVLLILAGISISAVIGENGIIAKAKQAKDKTREAQLKEQIELYEAEKIMAIRTGEEYKSIDEFVNDLESSGIITSEEKEEIIKNKEITIGDGEPIKLPYGKTLVQAFKDGDIKVGDYLDYAPSNASATVELNEIDTGYAETQIYKVDSSIEWRVLGLNEDETELLLISDSIIRKDGDNPWLIMGGAEAWYNGVDTLNKISKIYHNSSLASETRSITMEDINNAVGLVAEGNLLYKKGDATKTDLNEFAMPSDSKYVYKEGNFAPENYLKAKYPDNTEIQKLESKKVGDEVKMKGYSWFYSGIMGESGDEIIQEDSIIYDILFKDTVIMDAEGNLSMDSLNNMYWVATQTIGMAYTRAENDASASFGLAGVSLGTVYRNGN